MAINTNYENLNLYPAAGTNEASAPQKVYANSVVNGGETGESKDTVNTSTNGSSEARVTLKQLDERLAAVFAKNGVDWNVIKQEGKSLLTDIGYEMNFSLKKESLSEKAAQRIIKNVEKLINELKQNNQEINAENLLKVFREHSDDRILAKNGVTREDLETDEYKCVKNGLRGVLGLSEGEEITPEIIKSFMRTKIEESKARLEGITDPDEIERIQNEEIAKQKKLFAACLVNTSEKDRKAFLDAIEHMFADNRDGFLEDLLAAVPEEERTKLAKKLSYQKIKSMSMTPDAFNRRVSKKACTRISARAAQIQDAQTVKAKHAEMMEEAKEVLAEIQKKIDNGEELTEEEKAQYEFYTAYQAGEQIGTANSFTIQEDETIAILETMNADAYSLPTYREVLNQVNEFVEENPEILTTSKEEFTRLMDKTTNGNYTTVVNDTQNGTTSELNQPKVTVHEYSGSSSADLGFTTNNRPVDVTRPQTSKEELYAQTEILETEKQTETGFATKEECKEYKKENGKVSFIKHVFTNGKNSQVAIQEAITSFSRFNTSMQAMTLKLVNNFGLTNLLPEASDSTLTRLKGETFNNFYATKLVNDKAEEVEEKMA